MYFCLSFLVILICTMIRFFYLMTFFWFVTVSHQEVKAQVDYEPETSIRVELGLPAALEVASNRAFKDLLQGLMNLSVGYQRTFENSFSIGFGARYVLFNVNEFRNNFNLSGQLHFVGGFGRVGFEKYFGNLGIDYGLKWGYAYNISNMNTCVELNGKASISEGGFVEPNFSMQYLVNDSNAFTLVNLAYAFHSMRFQPGTVCVDDFPGLSESDVRNRTSYLTLGFGYTHFFGRN